MVQLLHSDDLPSFPGEAGSRLVHLPNRWELQDAPYFVFNYQPAYPAGQSRIASYDQVFESWRTEFDGYCEQGGCYLLGLDAQSIGTPGKADMLEELLQYIVSTNDAWIARCADIATWWSARHDAGQRDESERVRNLSRH